MTKPSKHPYLARGIHVALMLLAFGLLGWVIYDNRDEIRKVFSRKLDFRLIALAFAVYMTGLIVVFFRWYFLVRVVEPSFRLRHALLLGFIGNVFNLVIPGAVGGDLIKAAYLVRMKVKKTQSIASMILDRILGLLGLFILAGVSGALAWHVAGPVVKRLIVMVWVFLAVGFLGLAAIFGEALTRRYPGLLAGPGKLALLLKELKTLSATYRRRLGVVFAALGMASFSHTLNVLAFYLVSRTMFPANLPSVSQHFLIVPLVLFTTAVPIPFGALGLTEKVSEELFRLVAHPHGGLAMMGFRVLMYAGGLVSVGVYLANLHQVRGLSQTAEHLEEELLEGGLDGQEEPRPDDSPQEIPA